MAIYHCSIKIISCGKGKSAVSAAAYRAGETLTNQFDGIAHDYTCKGGVVHSEIILPPHAPPSFSDRSTLWNSVELDENGERIRLPSGRYKSRKVDLVDWNSQENAEVWRAAWADLANEFLERNNSPERIDHRSYERQGIDQIPTVHVGVSASQMEKKSIATLVELDASLSSVSEKSDAIRSGMKAAEQRMKELQKLIGNGKNYLAYKPIHDEHKQIRWKGKQEKYAEVHCAELTLWNAASRYLHARLPEGVKSIPIAAWEKEYAALKARRETGYAILKDTRTEVAELQNIRKCVDIAQRAEQPEQTQTKKHEQER